MLILTSVADWMHVVINTNATVFAYTTIHTDTVATIHTYTCICIYNLHIRNQTNWKQINVLSGVFKKYIGIQNISAT